MFLHCQKLTLREISAELEEEEIFLSHQGVNDRLNKIKNALRENRQDDYDYKRNLIIKEHEALKKKAWSIIRNGGDFAFKWGEIILKANQELAKLDSLYLTEKEKGKDSNDNPLQGLIDSIDRSVKKLKE